LTEQQFTKQVSVNLSRKLTSLDGSNLSRITDIVN